jgi:uncharacterized membrane protein
MRKVGMVQIAVGAAMVAGSALVWLRHAMEAETSWADSAFSPTLLIVLAVAGAVDLAVGLVLYGRGLAGTHDAPGSFLTAAEDTQVMSEIESFEKRTSGELRVHLESHVEGDLMAAARGAFDKLGLSATRERNGVLFFVAVKDHRFAVLGDSGIDQKVPAGFWDNVVAHVGERFKQGKFGEGLAEGIRMAGEQLAAHFPPRADDVNELPNQISRGTT